MVWFKQYTILDTLDLVLQIVKKKLKKSFFLLKKVYKIDKFNFHRKSCGRLGWGLNIPTTSFTLVNTLFIRVPIDEDMMIWIQSIQ